MLAGQQGVSWTEPGAPVQRGWRAGSGSGRHGQNRDRPRSRAPPRRAGYRCPGYGIPAVRTRSRGSPPARVRPWPRHPLEQDEVRHAHHPAVRLGQPVQAASPPCSPWRPYAHLGGLSGHIAVPRPPFTDSGGGAGDTVGIPCARSDLDACAQNGTAAATAPEGLFCGAVPARAGMDSTCWHAPACPLYAGTIRRLG
jgi:hypothetical protein